jgi:hypothetical protein
LSPLSPSFLLLSLLFSLLYPLFPFLFIIFFSPSLYLLHSRCPEELSDSSLLLSSSLVRLSPLLPPCLSVIVLLLLTDPLRPPAKNSTATRVPPHISAFFVSSCDNDCSSILFYFIFSLYFLACDTFGYLLVSGIFCILTSRDPLDTINNIRSDPASTNKPPAQPTFCLQRPPSRR